MFSYAIIGLGPAGLIALGHLPQDVLRSTVVFEPGCIGGDLAALYGTVRANIPTSVVRAALQSVPAWSSAPLPYLAGYGEEECPRLMDAVKQMCSLAADRLRVVDFHAMRVDGLEELASGGWRLQTSDGKFYDTKNLFLCTGAKPQTLNLPIPMIPLSIALNGRALAEYLTPSDRVVVFGTAHSGTLVLKHLYEAGVREVTAVYKSERPFRYFRDGDSEGIKQESEHIADAIVKRAWGDATPTLLRADAMDAVYRALHRATYVIYAIGFAPPKWTYRSASDGTLKPLQHDPATSAFIGVSGAWGFGLGFPTRYTAPNGQQYSDVGFGPFSAAIRAALSASLASSA